MSQHHRSLGLELLACLAGLALSSASLAQAPRGSVDVPVSPGAPEYRDPVTGRVWTPANVGQVSGPNSRADRAFDPLAQAAVVEGTIIQQPLVTVLGPCRSLPGRPCPSSVSEM